MILCPYCKKWFQSLGIMRHRTACKKKLHPSIDCKCGECRRVGKFLKENSKVGKINLVGCPEDLNKL